MLHIFLMKCVLSILKKIYKDARAMETPKYKPWLLPKKAARPIATPLNMYRIGLGFSSKRITIYTAIILILISNILCLGYAHNNKRAPMMNK
ncbi:hypothetical protein D3C79_906070 [compost metagenome]